MLRLHCFGTVHVERDGQPIGGAASQRRLLAILSVLAAHGTPGVSRDKLLALLWPDGEPERSRHALTQSLYNIRRALQCDDVVLVGSDLRLNPAVITSDVADFEGALERGELERVADVYEGPFLDGLHIGQSPEFERWTAEQRGRYAAQAAKALDALADAHARRGELQPAADARRRRVLLDPLDSGAVQRLMHALAALGDHATAINQARIHAQRLRSELGVAPSPELLDLETRLRQQLAHGARRAPTPSADNLPSSGRSSSDGTDVLEIPASAAAPAAPAVPASLAANAPPHDPAPRPTHREAGISLRGPRTRWLWAASAVIVVVATSWYLRRPSVDSAEGAETQVSAPIRQPLVVAPFRVTAADPSLRYLNEGMVELLASRLADDSTARAVDPGAVLAAWRAAGGRTDTDVSRTEAIRLAERLGARMLVTGSVVGGAAHVVLSASVVSLATGESLFSERVDGPIDSLTTLVDRLATQLLATDAGVSERLPVHRLPPLPAVRAFLNGQAAYRRERYAEATREFERALDADSTFALAALRLALAADKLSGTEQHDRALDLAWRYQDRLNAADQAHLLAFAGPRYPAPSSEAEQLAAWDRAATLAPDRSEVWQEVGERFFYHGAVIGSVDWRARATSAFRRALDLDPSAEGARVLLLLSAARSADTAMLRQFDVAQDSLLVRAPFVRWRLAQALGDRAELARRRAAMPEMSTSDLRWIAMSALYDGVEPDDAARALRIAKARTTRSVELVDVLLAEHSLALNEGRAIFALDLTEQLEQLSPATGAHMRLRILDALYGDGEREAAQRAVAAMEGLDAAHRGTTTTDREVSIANLCVLEQWRIAHGDRRSVARSVGILRSAPPARRSLPVSTPPLACAELLETMAAVSGRRQGTLARLQRLDSLMLTGPAIGDAATYAPIAIAGMYERLGASREGLDAIRRRPYMSGWPRYLATARREEGRIARRLGETEAAATVLRRYLALRRPEGAEPAREDQRIRDFVRSVGAE